MPTSEIQMLSLPASVVSIIEESPRHRSPQSKGASELKELRKLEFELGRSLAHRALQQAGMPADENRFDLRPILGVNDDRSPIWPAGFFGSISHSDRWVWVAVSCATEFVSIGIDTEVIVDPIRATELRDSIGRNAEWERMTCLGLADNIAFTLLFSAKEAFFKLCYPLTKNVCEFQDLEVVSVRMDVLTDSQKTSSAGEILLRSREPVFDLESRSVAKPKFDPFATSHPASFQIIGNDVFTFASIPANNT